MKTTAVAGLFLLGAALSGCGRTDGDALRTSARAATVPGPPRVTSTSPTGGASGVPINSLIAAAFSEDMDPSSLDAAFTLAGPSGPVAGTVVYDGESASATFVPAALLAANTLYTATVATGARDVEGYFLRAAATWSFTTARAESVPPAVVGTVPAAGATAAPNASLLATFSEAMNPATLTGATFTVTPAGGSAALAGTVQYDAASRSAILTAPLASGTAYTATVTAGAQDAAGNALAAPVTWSFTTASSADLMPPAAVGTLPAGAEVPAGTPITATFDEPVDPRTVTASSFTLSSASGAVSGSASYDPLTRTATFTPASALALGIEYTVRLAAGGDGVKDLAGNALAAPVSWTFALAVRYAGFVSNRTVDNDWHVRTNANAWWGTPMRSDRGLRLEWVVARDGDHWQYTYTLVGAEKAVNKWVNGFALASPEGFEVTDLLGGWTLVEPVNGVIVDGEARDGYPTDVTSLLTRPAAAAQQTAPSGLASLFGIRWRIADNTNFQTDTQGMMLILSFSTRRAPAWGDIFLESPVPSGGGPTTAWNWHLGDWTDDAVADGNNGGWVLVPGALGPDTEPPRLLPGLHPAAGSVGLGVRDSIRVSFSEAVDGPALVDGGAFTLEDGSGNPVSGTVSYDPLTYAVCFVPSAPLAYSSVYTARVAAVSDLAGHDMEPVAWTFTTEAPDVVLPRVLSTSPASGDTDVAIGAAVSARFSEAIDASTLGAFAVHDTSGGEVAGATTYAEATHTATFTPAAPLAYGTTYTASISGAQDLTGNPMAGAVTWSFTTSAAPPHVPTGDVNGDGLVDFRDAQLALRIATGEVAPSGALLRDGDVAPLVAGAPAPDGKIDTGDVLVILRKIAGEESW